MQNKRLKRPILAFDSAFFTLHSAFPNPLPMRIILNADDFGYDDDTLAATIECFEAGALTSATVMPKMPATARAIAYGKANPRFSFGAHLTFIADTVEAPFSNPADIPALVRPDGRFRDSQELRLMALRGKVPVEQIEREMALQLAFLRDHGVPVSHVDSHGHLHKFKPFVEAMKRVLPKFGIRRVRTAQDVYLRRPFKSPTYWLGGFWRRRIRRHFVTTDHLYMGNTPEDAERLANGELILLLKEETIEVGVHPGHAEAWRQDEWRAAAEFAKRATEAGHRFATWNDI
jgi:predicted glycoside hydrolase/deacetylase ChbG (UPF0249 family)